MLKKMNGYEKRKEWSGGPEFEFEVGFHWNQKERKLRERKRVGSVGVPQALPCFLVQTVGMYGAERKFEVFFPHPTNSPPLLSALILALVIREGPISTSSTASHIPFNIRFFLSCAHINFMTTFILINNNYNNPLKNFHDLYCVETTLEISHNFIIY